MAYQNFNQFNQDAGGQRQQQQSVNTRGPKFVNADANDCAMVIDYWKDMIKISFAPKLPKNLQSEFRLYDYDHSLELYVRRRHASALYLGYIKYIEPAIQENRQESIAIQFHESNQLILDTNVVDGVCHPRIRYATNINTETLIAGNIVEYEFFMGEVARNYNPETGEHGNVERLNSELELFMRDLNSEIEAQSMAYVHAERDVNNRFRRSIDSKLDRIGEANGLRLGTSPQYTGNGGGGRGSILNNNDLPFSADEPSVPNQKVGSIEELNEALTD